MKKHKTNKELILDLQKQIRILTKRVKELEDDGHFLHIMTQTPSRHGPLIPL